MNQESILYHPSSPQKQEKVSAVSIVAKHKTYTQTTYFYIPTRNNFKLKLTKNTIYK